MSLPYPLLSLLADGRFHSGAVLGGLLGVSRSAVWKRLRTLADLGLDVQAVRGKGYRLSQPLQLLDMAEVRAHLAAPADCLLGGLHIEAMLDSTSQWLLTHAGDLPAGTACLAEMQRQGRGRRGRQWVSPLAAHIYLSVLWRFPAGAGGLSGLSLAMGVAIMRCLRTLGISDAGLKWPNDVHWQGRKLAGILVDLTGEMAGPCTAVIGVGLNWRMPPTAAGQLDQPWTDLHTLMHGAPVSRSRVAGVLLGELLRALSDFERHGLTAFLSEWRQWDAIDGFPIALQMPHETFTGVACGVDAQGALRVERDGEIVSYTAGEVTLRTTA